MSVGSTGQPGFYHSMADQRFSEEEGEDGYWDISKRVALKFIKEECKVPANVRIIIINYMSKICE